MPAYTVTELLQMRLDGEQKSVDLALEAVKQAQEALDADIVRRNAAQGDLLAHVWQSERLNAEGKS
jgi:hypothetical protein